MTDILPDPRLRFNVRLCYTIGRRVKGWINMAKPFLNLRPGVDFPEDGTDVLPYIQALERKCMELEDANVALAARVKALEDAE